MKLIEKIAGEAKALGADKRVESVCIGQAYCVTVLKSGEAGLSWVFRGNLQAGCNLALPSRPLAGKTAGELLDFAGFSPLANSIVLSTANAVFAPHAVPETAGDFTERFEIEAGMKVGMVGHFATVERTIRAKGAELLIFDLHPKPQSDVLDAAKIPDILPGCDVAILTATAIVNETIDDLLSAASSCSHTGILGPSTPLHPACYAGTPVTSASGVLIRDPASIVQVVAEAGGMQLFKPYVDKVNVTV